jgi:membrane protein implicated in regulation of membrane protease activity
VINVSGGAPTGWQPPGPDLVWVLGSLVTVVLAPVAVGLSAWSGVVALWSHGDLPDLARRLHLVTLVLTAVFAVTFAAAWAGGAFTWFRG